MRNICLYLFVLTVITACKEKYDLPTGGPSTGYLVVDGVINSGQGPTTLRLTRSLALVDSVTFSFVEGAFVRIEGEDNSTQVLDPQPGGYYYSPQLNFLDGVKYRLRINTSDDKEYVSDFVPALRTPDIDALTWEKDDKGVTIFVNTHDPQNKTIYYRWEYEETWEIRSAFYSSLQYERNANGDPVDVEPRPYQESQDMYTCWRHTKSTSILIGSSAKLSRDTIHLPILEIPSAHERISVMYSINVTQYAASRAGYEFLQRMKKNTEQVGSLFDAQPSELVGNIKCVTNPTEPVIGFVAIADAKQKRLFIKYSEVMPWAYNQGCYVDSVENHPDSLIVFSTFIPTEAHRLSPTMDTISVWVTEPRCADCRLRGTPLKPSFWP